MIFLYACKAGVELCYPLWPVLDDQSHTGKSLIFLSCVRSHCLLWFVDCLPAHEIFDTTKPRYHIFFMIITICKHNLQSLRSYVYNSSLIVENTPLYP